MILTAQRAVQCPEGALRFQAVIPRSLERRRLDLVLIVRLRKERGDGREDGALVVIERRGSGRRQQHLTVIQNGSFHGLAQKRLTARLRATVLVHISHHQLCVVCPDGGHQVQQHGEAHAVGIRVFRRKSRVHEAQLHGPLLG